MFIFNILVHTNLIIRSSFTWYEHGTGDLSALTTSFSVTINTGRVRPTSTRILFCSRAWYGRLYKAPYRQTALLHSQLLSVCPSTAPSYSFRSMTRARFMRLEIYILLLSDCVDILESQPCAFLTDCSCSIEALKFAPQRLCLVGVEGIEPPTDGLESQCSINLSYTPITTHINTKRY